MSTNKILNSTESICLFCGQPEKQRWEDRSPYYECDCKDAIKTREINTKISELKRSLPTHKYEIRQKQVLIKLENEHI